MSWRSKEKFSFEEICRALNQGQEEDRRATKRKEWAEKLIDSGWDLWFIVGGSILVCFVLPAIFFAVVLYLTKPR